MDDSYLRVGAKAPPCRPEVLRVAAFQERSVVAGPGQRAVIWVAGCLRRCPGCFQPAYRSFVAGQPVRVQTLAHRILAIDHLEGVTYSGGEPFEQALPLASLSRLLKTAGLSIAAYSGYTRDALERDRERFGPLLEELDLLIDGEYRQELPGPFRWRGSANQHVHALTTVPPAARDAVRPVSEHSEEPVREVQLFIEDERIRLTGFPDAELERALAARLRSRGIVLKKVCG